MTEISFPTNINPLQPGQVEDHKVIHVGPNTLLMTIRPGIRFDHIYLGGKELYCVHISIPKKGKYDSAEEIAIGSFDSLKYDSKCAIGNELVKEVTAEVIVKILLTYITHTYPYVKGLRFTDSSEKTCNNWTTIALSDMSFITNGKTWYEKHFDAYIDKDSIDVYTREMEYIKQKKQTTTWDMLLYKIPALQQFKDMRSVFENSLSWQEFFGALRDKLGGTPYFCMFASEWLSDFMTRYLRIRFTKYTYIMPVKSYNDITFNIEPYYTGGRRKRTMRRHRYSKRTNR